LDPDSPEWKANEPKKWRLSTVNTNDMKDMKCINGVKRVYGTVVSPPLFSCSLSSAWCTLMMV